MQRKKNKNKKQLILDQLYNIYEGDLRTVLAVAKIKEIVNKS